MQKSILLCLSILLLVGLNQSTIQAQSPTPGFIYLPATGAGAGVLDPNGNGYTSTSGSGFVTDDVTESEIPFVPVPPLFPETSGDNVAGPACGFTDLVSSNSSGVFSYLDASNNLMFRFRLGNSIRGSKGYAILIDTDGKFGNTGANADPNYIGGSVGNPGFEVEIVLETNFKVALYDVDGMTSGVLKASLPVSQYSQESVALSNNCGNPDYFYDFFMPFSVITTYFPSLTPATPVRFVGVTVMAPKEALSGPASDTFGAGAGTLNQQWTDIINAQPPTCFNCTGGGYPPCSDAPVVNTPIAVGASSVSGTSTEANGTTIRVYKNGSIIGTTSVTGGAWTLTGITPTFVNGDTIAAKAQASGESACLFSNRIIVSAGCTNPPSISCITRKGAQGNGPTGAPIGTTIKGYQLTATGGVLAFTVATVAGNTWAFDCGGGGGGCTGGTNCVNDGTYFTTATAPGQCESDASVSFNYNCGSASSSPTVTTNPIYDFTTTITGTSSTPTGTVYLFINKTYYSSATVSAGSWSISSLTLTSGDTLDFEKVDGVNCVSPTVTKYVICQTSVATLNTPIVSGATSVSGTSTEASGTTITVYKNGSSIGTTSVLSDGTWIKSSIGALNVGDNIYVTQISGSCTVSAAGPTTTVVANTPPPVIVGTYYEQNTSVSGTSPSPSGTVIRLYIDGFYIGTTTVDGAGAWTVSGLVLTDLYAGGILSATAQETGLGISPLSNLVTVLCVDPLSFKSVTTSTPFICKNDSASIQIISTENLVVYTIVNQATTSPLSVSRLGNGMNLIVITFALNSSQWVKVRAEKIGGTSCFVYLSDSIYINVSNYPDSTVSYSAPSSVCIGSSATVTISSSQNGMQYQLRDSTTNVNVGSAVAGNGGSISLNTGAINSAKTFYIWVVNTSTSANCSGKLSGYIPISVSSNASSNAGTNQDLCNVTSTTLAGNTPSAGSGTWTLVSGPNTPVITSSSNPSTTVTSMISGVYIFKWTVVNGSCSENSNVQITIYSNPTASNAGVDQSICSTTTTATLSGNTPASGNGTWTEVSGPNTATIISPFNPGSSVSNLIAGVYIFRWTISNGVCSASSSDVQISVSALPTTANSGADQSLCNVNNVTLNGNSPAVGSGIWTLISGPNSPVITTPSSSNTTVSGMISGTYIFRWTISNGICTNSTDDIQVTIYSLPNTSNAGIDQNLCNVSSTSMAGNNPSIGTGNWSVVSGPNTPTIVTPTSSSTNITGMTAGVYIFRWSISNGVCTSSTDDIQITIYSLPTASNAGSDQNLCNVNSATLTGNSPASGTGLWSQISGPNSSSIAIPTSASTALSGMIAGTYIFRWTISNGVCTSSTDDISITVYSLPTVSSAGINQDLCNVSSTTLAANVPTTGTGNWTLVSGPNVPTITTPTSNSSSVTGMIAGTYIFRWNISNGVCSPSADDVQIVIYATPSVAAAGADMDLCNVTSVTLNGNTPVTGNGIWSLVSGPNIPSITSPSLSNTTITGMISGNYIFRWTISNGVCASSSDDVAINIFDLPTTADAGADQSLCSATIFTLNGNTPLTGNGVWTIVSAPNVPVFVDSSDATTQVTNIISGVYIFRWTITNGVCTASSNDVQITNYNSPTTVDAGIDQNLCNVSNTTLAANTPASGIGTWTVIGGPNAPVFSSVTNPLATISSLIAGTYTLGWTINNGTCTSSTDTVILNVYDLPTTSDAGADQSLCSTTTINITGNTPVNGTGNWTFLSGPNSPSITSPSSPSTSVTGVVAGTYLFSWSISNGTCTTSRDTVQIQIFNIPLIVDAGTDQQLCDSSLVLLNGNTPSSGVGTWTLLNGPSPVTFVDANDPNTLVNGLISGTYNLGWTINNGVCATPTDTATIINYTSPTLADAGADITICDTTTATLAAVSPSIGSGVWTILIGPNSPAFVDSSAANTNVNNLIPGTYNFIWTTNNGICLSSSDTLTIIVNSLPVIANGGTDQDVCDVNTVTLSANNATPAFGSWSQISGPSVSIFVDSTNENTPVTGLVAGVYTFRWNINNQACTSTSDDVQINISPLPSTANAGSDQNLCNTFMTNMNAAALVSGVGQWNQIGGPNLSSIDSIASPTAIVSGMISGSYSFTWIVSNGTCASNIDTVQLVIYDLPSTSNAGNDQQLCNENIITLSGNNPSVGSGNWTFISGPNNPSIASANSPSTNVSGVVPGTYIFEWSISNGVCSNSVDSVSVIISSMPVTVDAGSDQEFCNVTNVSFIAPTPGVGIGTWTQISGPGTATIVAPNDPTSVINNLIPGIYEFGWSIDNGSCTSVMDTTLITIYPSPDNANAGSDQSLCNVSSVTLNGNVIVNGQGVWSLLSGPIVPLITSPSNENTTVTNMVAGNYLFMWTSSNGTCSDNSDTVLILISDLPSTAVCGGDQILCNVSSVIIDADFPAIGTGSWSVLSGPNNPTILSNASAVTVVDNVVPGTYVFQWTVSNNACTPTIDTLQVTISTIGITPDAGVDQSLCNASSTMLAAVPVVNGAGMWSLQFGNATIVSPTSDTTILDNLTQGNYTLRWTVSNGVCSAFDEMQIIVNAPPSVTINNHQVSLCDATETTIIASGADTYSWSPAATLSNSTIYNPVASPLQTTVYYVTGTDVNGCTATDSALVEVCDTLIIPNGFSPDDDGVNDEFIISGIVNYPDNTLKIFNRWGNLLYEKKEYDNSWNGSANTGSVKFGNGKVTAGTYFYILELGAGNLPRTGFIVIRY